MVPVARKLRVQNRLTMLTVAEATLAKNYIDSG